MVDPAPNQLIPLLRLGKMISLALRRFSCMVRHLFDGSCFERRVRVRTALDDIPARPFRMNRT